MPSRHVTHLLTHYVHGQLRAAERARLINHVRACADCRAALAREEEIAGLLRREMPRLGQPRRAQLATVWAGVWQEVGMQHQGRPRPGSTWLPGLSAILAVVAILAIALPMMLLSSGVHAESAPLLGQARPISTASPTPGSAGQASAEPGSLALPAVARVQPPATVAYAALVAASPAPVPEKTVSPEAPLGAVYH